MKILQLGKFYPVLGGVEKVMFDLTAGLSETGLSETGLSETGLSEVGALEGRALGSGAFGGGSGVRHDVRGKRREGDGGHPA